MDLFILLRETDVAEFNIDNYPPPRIILLTWGLILYRFKEVFCKKWTDVN
jgi:hypothetical protein